MFVSDVLESGAIPVLELAMRFSARRQEVIAHNIANLNTPDFRPMDADPGAFQRALGEAIDRRRAQRVRGGADRARWWRNTREVEVGADGRMRLHPRTPSGNVLFQDRNNRDVERLMQSLAENVAVFRMTSDLLRSRYGILDVAISQRV